jgi:holo-[acyl-carrier protein] synthase
VSGGELAAPVSALARSASLGLVDSVRSSAGVVGVGIDAVDIERMGRVLGRRLSMADRLFTPDELAYARAATDPVPRLSTRFAAKEAVMKALGVGLGAFPFVDVEVVRKGLDAPRLVLRGEAAALADRSGVGRWHLSLTHTDQVALAVALAEGGPGGAALAEGGPGGAALAEGGPGGARLAESPVTP